MQVFLVRHAEAVDETLAIRDPHRHLTTHGRIQARAIGDRLRWHDCHPTQIWTSPLVRAVQTAELVASGIGSPTAVETVPNLAPDGSPREIATLVRALPPLSEIVIVGHEPSLSAIGALLVGDPDFEALEKAQAARILDGTLRWRFAWNAEAPQVIAAR